MKLSIVKQRRKSLALQLTPKGLRVLIPRTLDEDDQKVQSFIDRSLESLPIAPKRLEEPLESETVYDLVERWAKKIRVAIQRVQLREMVTKWGSISSAGYLTLADDLLWLPIELVEYVVVHELIHMKFPNHAKGWQVTMGMYIPDWRERERKLQAYSLIENPSPTI